MYFLVNDITINNLKTDSTVHKLFNSYFINVIERRLTVSFWDPRSSVQTLTCIHLYGAYVPIYICAPSLVALSEWNIEINNAVPWRACVHRVVVIF